MDPVHAFLMQPYNYAHSDKLRDVVQEVLGKIKCDVRRADMQANYVSLRLQDRIDDHIKKADICIADLTTPRNENVLLEVGAALALQIPVVIISDSPLPSNIPGMTYVHCDTSQLNDDKQLELFRNRLRERTQEAISLIGNSSGEKFVAHGYPDREGVDFDLLIRRAEHRICILTTNLAYVVSKTLAGEDRSPKRTFLTALMEELPLKNPRFRTSILALDPDSNFANERALSLGRNRREFREELRSYLDELTTTASQLNQNKIDVRIYDDYPLQMTFFVDNVIVNSAVASSRSSRFCVTYVHNLTYRSARDTFEQHFSELWGRSKPYSPASSRSSQPPAPARRRRNSDQPLSLPPANRA